MEVQVIYKIGVVIAGELHSREFTDKNKASAYLEQLRRGMSDDDIYILRYTTEYLTSL